MPKQKPNKVVTPEILERIAKLDRRGWSQMEIAEVVGVSQPTVGQHLHKLRESRRDGVSCLLNREDSIGEKHEQYRDFLREVTDAWERSKSVAKKVVTREEPVSRCVICDGHGTLTKADRATKEVLTKPCPFCKGKGETGGVVEVIRTEEERLPDSAYIAQALRILEAERTMTGLDAPKKVDSTSKNLNVSTTAPWDEIAGILSSDEEVPDEVEARLLAIESSPSKADAIEQGSEQGQADAPAQAEEGGESTKDERLPSPPHSSQKPGRNGSPNGNGQHVKE